MDISKEVKYEIKRSIRAKRMRVTVRRDGSVIATIPDRFDINILTKFINEKKDWIISKVQHFLKFPSPVVKNCSRRDYKKIKVEACELVKQRLLYLNQLYGYKYNRISIRNQKTRWGSCSKRGNLNFNYKILFLSEQARDYIIVHELCHLKEFNHSKNFWNLVRVAAPDYLLIRRELRRR